MIARLVPWLIAAGRFLFLSWLGAWAVREGIADGLDRAIPKLAAR